MDRMDTWAGINTLQQFWILCRGSSPWFIGWLTNTRISLARGPYWGGFGRGSSKNGKFYPLPVGLTQIQIFWFFLPWCCPVECPTMWAPPVKSCLWTPNDPNTIVLITITRSKIGLLTPPNWAIYGGPTSIFDLYRWNPWIRAARGLSQNLTHLWGQLVATRGGHKTWVFFFCVEKHGWPELIEFVDKVMFNTPSTWYSWYEYSVYIYIHIYTHGTIKFYK